MKKIFYTVSFVVAFLTLLPQSAIATPAHTIYLRSDCTENGTTVPNCYTTLGQVTNALASINPDASNPLLVEIGPGSFPGAFQCNNVSHVTLHGAGRSNTILGSLSSSNNFKLVNCDHLNVSSLQIQGTYYLIEWQGTGISTWTDVDVVGAGIGWYDSSSTSCNSAETKHQWYSSRFEVHPYLTQSAAYVANCGSHWFYGSELVSTTQTLSGVAFPASGTNDVIRASTNAEVHVYGSVLRVLAPTDTTGTPSANHFKIVDSADGAVVHIHGTGMDAESALALNITALTASNGGYIHAISDSYHLKTANGTITRVLNGDGNGNINAPYNWQTMPDAPDIISINGYDTVTVTNTTDGFPHSVVYSSACSSHWYDTATHACR